MSKSLGNFLTIRELLERFHPEALKLYLLSSHYRAPVRLLRRRRGGIGESSGPDLPCPPLDSGGRGRARGARLGGEVRDRDGRRFQHGQGAGGDLRRREGSQPAATEGGDASTGSLPAQHASSVWPGFWAWFRTIPCAIFSKASGARGSNVGKIEAPDAPSGRGPAEEGFQDRRRRSARN